MADALNSLGKTLVTRERFLTLRPSLRRFHYAVGAVALLYIVFVSVTGSAIVFEHELYRLFSPDPAISSTGNGRLSIDNLKSIVAGRYPQHRIVGIWDRRLTDGMVVEVWLDGVDGSSRRLIHPQTGDDLGDAEPPSLRALELMRRAHVAILADGAGRVIHAAGALSLVALSISGVAARRRKRSPRQKRPERRSGHYSLAYHRVAGVWAAIVAASWGLTGACFLFQPFFDRLLGSAGEPVMEWLYALHSGAAGGPLMRVTWIVSAVSLVFIAVSGMVVAWERIRCRVSIDRGAITF